MEGKRHQGPGWIHVHGVKEKLGGSTLIGSSHRDPPFNLDPLLQLSLGSR